MDDTSPTLTGLQLQLTAAQTDLDYFNTQAAQRSTGFDNQVTLAQKNKAATSARDAVTTANKQGIIDSINSQITALNNQS